MKTQIYFLKMYLQVYIGFLYESFDFGCNLFFFFF